LDLNSVTNKEVFESVHLADFPLVNTSLVNKNLERKMGQAQIISSLVLSLRAKEKIKVRQPLQKIIIPVNSSEQRDEILAVSDLVKHEVNVKEVELLEDASEILVKQIKPNFKVLGPRFGKDMKLISNAIQKFQEKDIKEIEEKGVLEIEINGKSIRLQSSDVEITSQDIEGWLVANQGSITVALDVTVSRTLKAEGVARELVNRIQNLRKDSGFQVTDRIEVFLQADESLEDSIRLNLDYIKKETLTDNLQLVPQLNKGIEISFDEVNSKLYIQKFK
jgi:isoleucyl-tRNA synthetase